MMKTTSIDHVLFFLLFALPTGSWGEFTPGQRFVQAILDKEGETQDLLLVIGREHRDELLILLPSSDRIGATPFVLMDPEGLESYLTKSPCPIIRPFPTMTEEEREQVIPDDAIFLRREEVPRRESPKTVVVWSASEKLEGILDAIERTVLWCEQKVDMGLLRLDNHFIVIVQDQVHELLDVLSSRERVRSHPFFAVFDLKDRDFAIIHQLEPFDGSDRFKKTLTYFKNAGSLKSIYSHPLKLNGYNLRLIVAPNGHYLQVDYLSEEKSKPFQRLTNMRGIIFDLMQTFQE